MQPGNQRDTDSAIVIRFFAHIALLPRGLLIACIVLGVLVPRMGAVIGEAVGLQTFVICTGDGLRAVTLDQNGDPIETEIEDHGPCLAAIVQAQLTAPPSAWQRLIGQPDGPPKALGTIITTTVWDGPPPKRGPPAIV
ncbi:hypothetical protein [Pseudaestuariivita rosea]|uniref:hypothetical protein n=1 Tax=Pseudaestuariivita rosea TaxID=2763263 RepID=UPI001ABAE65F|nr:hypothetical protein [Pseudaestuariivita rosea]